VAQEPKFAYRRLTPGDSAPWFRQRCTSNPDYAFDTVAGRFIVLCFFGTAGDDQGRVAWSAIRANRHLFDDVKACCFGVSIDAADQTQGRLREMLPGVRHFWDFDGGVSRLYGALPMDESLQPGQAPARRFWMVLDPNLRVRAVFPFEAYRSGSETVFDYIQNLPPVATFAGLEMPAPILIVPNVFEPEFCGHLISLYQQHGGEESGFMREVNGKTVLATDPGHKKRKDYISQLWQGLEPMERC